MRMVHKMVMAHPTRAQNVGNSLQMMKAMMMLENVER